MLSIMGGLDLSYVVTHTECRSVIEYCSRHAPISWLCLEAEKAIFPLLSVE